MPRVIPPEREDVEAGLQQYEEEQADQRREELEQLRQLQEDMRVLYLDREDEEDKWDRHFEESYYEPPFVDEDDWEDYR